MKTKIPKELRQGLDERFDYKNRKKKGKFYVIDKPCVLCQKYRQCKDCPLCVGQANCIGWIHKCFKTYKFVFHLYPREVNWRIEDDKKAERQLAKLRKYAEKHIEWI